MLTWEDDVEVHALRKRGWSISAIARHTGFDRKTVRKYLAGDGKPGVRARPGLDPFDPFVDYVSARLVEDPHLWARTLLDELEDQFGALKGLVRNDQGEVHHHVNIYVNNEAIEALQGLDTTLKDGDEVSIIPALAGGGPALAGGGPVLGECGGHLGALASE